MSPSPVRKTVISLVGIVFAVISANPQAAVQSAFSERPISGFDREEAYLSDIATKLSKDTGVPIGLELLAGDDQKKLDVGDPGTALEAELNRIVQKEPRYKWIQDGQTINILPKENGPAVFDVMVSRFESWNATPYMMLSDLLRNPAVVASLAEEKVTANYLVMGSVPLNRANLQIENQSFRNILNRITIAGHGSGWISVYTENKKGGKLRFQLL